MIIDIAISTLNNGIENIKINNDFNYIIIHQVNDRKDYSVSIEKLLSYNVKYIRSDTIGLSKSRNIAIQNSEADFIWLMDDDVTIDNNAYMNILSLINSSHTFDMIVLSHTTIDEDKKNDVRIYSINKRKATSVSSIDMLIKRKSIIENEIFFNENFGLGTKYPSGEEYLFTIECLKRNLTVLKTTQVFSYHPPIASGIDFYSSENKLITKLKIFKISYGNLLGNLVYILFILKKSKTLIKNKKLISAIRIATFNKN